MALDQLITTYILQDLYSPAARKIVAATAQVASSQVQAKTAIQGTSNATGQASRIIEQFGNVAGSVATAGIAAATAALAALVGETVAISKASSKAAADFDGLVASVKAIEGSAGAASERLKELRQLAKEPGIGIQESIKGFTQLRNAGLSDALSEEVIRQFGNANARAGGGHEEFERILLAVSQIATAGYLQGGELRQLSNAGIPGRALVKQIFGTDDAEELKKAGVDGQTVIRALVLELAKFERVGDSSKNAFDNLADAAAMAEVQFGRALNNSIKPFADNLTNIFNIAQQGNVFQTLGDSIAGIFGDVDSSSLENAFTKVIAVAETAADVVGMLFNAVKGLLGPIGFVFGGSAIAKITGVDKLYDAHLADIQSSMEAGRKLQAQADKKTKAEQNKNLTAVAAEQSETGGATEPVRYLREIRDNTKVMADQITRRVVGGGGVGNAAFNAVNLGKFGGSRHERAGRLILQALDIMSQDSMDNLMNVNRRSIR